MAPDAPVTADVPGLDLAEVPRGLVDGKADIGNVDARPPLAGLVLLDLAFHVAAVVIVGGDVQHRGLRVVRRERPVLATPERGTELRALARARNALFVVRGTARGRIDALEDGLLDVRRRRHERNLVGAALEAVQIPVARRLDEPFHRFPILREVGDDGRVRLVPVPRLVPLVLEVRHELAGLGIDRDRGRRVEVIARALVAEPRRRVARAPIGQVQRWIVRPGDPDGSATLLPRVARPRLTALLTGRGDRVRLPRGLTAVGVKGLDEAADAELAARDADHHLALRHERGERHVVARLPVLDLLLPDDLAGGGVEGDEHAVVRRQVDLVAVEGHTAAGVV